MKGNYNFILEGNALDKLKEIDDESIDLIVTDPPYGYSFMGKEWDKAVVSVDMWRECLRVLKAGAFAFVMSAPRQDVLSRMIVNLQDAGFRTDFTSIYWTYASGFPKAANVSKLVDKRLGEEREAQPNPLAKKQTGQDAGKGLAGARNDNKLIYPIPKTEQAKKLDGSYAGFQPKPAVEVVLVVMKPLSEKTFVDQALNNGKGITWLDDCRLPFQNEKDLKSAQFGTPGLANYNRKNFEQGYRPKSYYEGRTFDIKPNEKGRFPANLLVSDDSLNDGKITKSEGGKTVRKKDDKIGNWGHGDFHMQGYGDSGSYSRYFDLDSWYDNRAQFIITPKASASERNQGCEDLEGVVRFASENESGSMLPTKTDKPHKIKGNFHPTVKPLKLMSYLITLGSRENDIVLDPFCGSGTTLIAAEQLHRKWIGIELNAEYAEIARKRIEPYLVQQKLL